MKEFETDLVPYFVSHYGPLLRISKRCERVQKKNEKLGTKPTCVCVTSLRDWWLPLSDAKDQPTSHPCSKEPKEASISDWSAQAEAGTSICITHFKTIKSTNNKKLWLHINILAIEGVYHFNY